MEKCVSCFKTSTIEIKSVSFCDECFCDRFELKFRRTFKKAKGNFFLLVNDPKSILIDYLISNTFHKMINSKFYIIHDQIKQINNFNYIYKKYEKNKKIPNPEKSIIKNIGDTSDSNLDNHTSNSFYLNIFESNLQKTQAEKTLYSVSSSVNKNYQSFSLISEEKTPSLEIIVNPKNNLSDICYDQNKKDNSNLSLVCFSDKKTENADTLSKENLIDENKTTEHPLTYKDNTFCSQEDGDENHVKTTRLLKMDTFNEDIKNSERLIRYDKHYKTAYIIISSRFLYDKKINSSISDNKNNNCRTIFANSPTLQFYECFLREKNISYPIESFSQNDIAKISFKHIIEGRSDMAVQNVKQELVIRPFSDISDLEIDAYFQIKYKCILNELNFKFFKISQFNEIQENINNIDCIKSLENILKINKSCSEEYSGCFDKGFCINLGASYTETQNDTSNLYYKANSNIQNLNHSNYKDTSQDKIDVLLHNFLDEMFDLNYSTNANIIQTLRKF